MFKYTLSDYEYLVAKGLATVSINAELRTFKYHRKVMYDNLWKTDERLLECRGIVFNNLTGELVQLPFRKSFNYLENNHWADVPLDTLVKVFKKYNGFMAACSPYKDDLLVSTTGTTTSNYARLAKEEIQKACDGYLMFNNYTYLFEIIHESDPHIVKEDFGVRPLGYRDKTTGRFQPLGVSTAMTLRDAIAFCKEDRGEGFMVYTKDDTECLNPCKMKTPYYIGKKKLMRMNNSMIDTMYSSWGNFQKFQNSLPEMYQHIPAIIIHKYAASQWKVMHEQKRREFIESHI